MIFTKMIFTKMIFTKMIFTKIGVSRRQDLVAALTGRTPPSVHAAP
jgi:hypothetical protein